MRVVLMTAVAGLAVFSVATATADSAPVSSAHGSQCFKSDEVSGFARHDAHSAFVRVDNDRVFALNTVGDCGLLANPGRGLQDRIGRAQLISRTRDWFCTGDTADLLPANHTGSDRCSVTIGHELHR